MASSHYLNQFSFITNNTPVTFIWGQLCSKCSRCPPLYDVFIVFALLLMQISAKPIEWDTDNTVALNVWGQSYLGLTRSIPWLLMPWLLTSPGNQQPWYWLYRICRFFSYLRRDFKYLCQINVEEWHKMQIHVYITSEKFSTWRINSLRPSDAYMRQWSNQHWFR